jgi:hypothetical protein
MMKQWLDKHETDEKKAAQLAKYWDTILLWSGYNCYMERKLIARILKIDTRTLDRRLAWFKKNYPEQYEKIKKDRETIRSASVKLDKQIKEMNEGKFLSWDSLDPNIRDSLVKEKF